MPRVGGAQGQRPARARREAGIDPICHTLVGAALARSGLSKRTALGTATLLIGANLPDIDVLAYLDGPGADLAFRRGWTHGVLALAVLPFALTGLILLFDRGVRRLRRAVLPSPVVPGQILLLSSVSILSHPLLDTLNTYGVRWLMPFSGRWFYGDALYIVDPWVWLALALGLGLSRERRGARRTEATRPARAGLMIVTAYAVGMTLSGIAARRIAASELAALTGAPVTPLMVGPVALTPLVRKLVAAQDGSYLTGTFRWLRRPHLDPETLRSFPRAPPSHPAVGSASATAAARRFLSWARFPVFQVETRPDGSTLVHIVDLRYADRAGASFGAVTIDLASPPASVPSPDSRPASSPTGPAAPAR